MVVGDAVHGLVAAEAAGESAFVWSDMLLLLLLLGGSYRVLRLRKFCISDLLHASVVEDAVHGLVAAKAAGAFGVTCCCCCWALVTLCS
jgi:beta-phosphoglucomutase-like phosphatase (HAD superfamily)